MEGTLREKVANCKSVPQHSMLTPAAPLLGAGSGQYNQIGDGVAGTTSRLVPTQESTSSTWTAVALGSDFTCAIRATSNNLYCWYGREGEGEGGRGGGVGVARER